jgi:beta-mannosidase
MVTSYPEPKEKLSIWAVSGHLTSISTILKLRAFDIETGKEISLPSDAERKVELKANGTTEIGDLNIPSAGSTIIVAYLSDAKTGELLARWVDWPEPLKFVVFKKDVEVKIEVDEGGKEVRISANAPVKGVVLGVGIEDGEDAVWEDNFIELVPGEVVKVGVDGLKGRKVNARWLCDWENEVGFEL